MIILHQPCYSTVVLVTVHLHRHEEADFSYLGRLDAKFKKQINNKLVRPYKNVSIYLEQEVPHEIHKNKYLQICLLVLKGQIIYQIHFRHIKYFHQRCLRTILSVHWSSFTTNTIVLKTASNRCIEVMWQNAHLS